MREKANLFLANKRFWSVLMTDHGSRPRAMPVDMRPGAVQPPQAAVYAPACGGVDLTPER
jgi:hypothetical protein